MTTTLDRLTDVAAAINRAASAEIAANLIPSQIVAWARDDEDTEPVGALRIHVDIAKWREYARTYTDAGRAELARESAAVERILTAARRHGTVERVGSGSMDGSPVEFHELTLSSATS